MNKNQDDSEDLNHDSAITKHNLVEKLCFVVTGDSIANRAGECRQALTAYNGIRGDKLVTNEAIGKWLANDPTKRTTPAREKAYTFLSSFLDEHISYDDLSPDRKKVFNQIVGRLEDSLRERVNSQRHKAASNHSVSVGNAGAVIIHPVEATPRDYEELVQSWTGTYVTYRYRLVADEGRPFAREVVRLVKTNSGLTYRHWHLKDGTALKSFQGTVLVSKDTLWMIGVDEGNQRFRICHVKRNETLNPDFQRFRWGLMHSDIPMGSSRDPASTKIFMKKIDVRKSIETFAEKTVSYLGEDLGGDVDAEKIRRAISNNISSQSDGSGFEPVSEQDEVLRTCHLTLEAMLRT